jgi:hypothetical protein
MDLQLLLLLLVVSVVVLLAAFALGMWTLVGHLPNLHISSLSLHH